MTKFTRHFSFALLFGVLLSSPCQAAQVSYNLVFQNRSGKFLFNETKQQNDVTGKKIYEEFYKKANFSISTNKQNSPYKEYIDRHALNKLVDNYPNIEPTDLTILTIHWYNSTNGKLILLDKNSSNTNLDGKVAFPGNNGYLFLKVIPPTLPAIYLNGKVLNSSDFLNQQSTSPENAKLSNLVAYLKQIKKLKDNKIDIKGRIITLTEAKDNGKTVQKEEKLVNTNLKLYMYSTIHVTDSTAPDKNKTIFEKFRGLSGIKQFFIVVIVVAAVGVVAGGAAKLIHIWSQKKKLSSLTNEDDTEESEEENNEEN